MRTEHATQGGVSITPAYLEEHNPSPAGALRAGAGRIQWTPGRWIRKIVKMESLPALLAVRIPDSVSAVDAAPIAAWNHAVVVVREQYSRGLTLCEVAGRRAVAGEGPARELLRQHAQGRELVIDAAMRFVRLVEKRPEIVAYAWTLVKASAAAAEAVAKGRLTELRRNTLWPDRDPGYLELEAAATNVRAAAGQPQDPLLPEHLEAVKMIKVELRAFFRAPFSAQCDSAARALDFSR